MKIVCCFIFCFLFSCDKLTGTEDLGNGYFFDTDEILYVENKYYNGIGICVIPDKVVQFDKNEDYVIIKSLNKYNEEKFWIICKKTKPIEIGCFEADMYFNSYYIYNNIIGPLEEDYFQYELKSKNINLRFSN